MRIRSIAIVSAVVGLTLSACSSDPEPVATPTPSPSLTEEILVDDAAILIDACGTYYEWDLVRSTVKGAEDIAKKQSRALLKEYRLLADTMVTDMDAAVVAGELPAAALTNAERIATNLGKAKTKQGIAGINAKQAERIDASAARIEAACEAAGDLVPQENLDARSLVL